MSDAIKHECGIALVRLKKPLQFYKDKYGTVFYGINKMYLLMEKQHNRGQDGAGFASVKFNVAPGTRYISRVRSNQSQPIQDIFGQINQRLKGPNVILWLSVIFALESFLFLPLDLILAGCCFKNPSRAFLISTTSAISSTIGSLAGYFMGILAMSGYGKYWILRLISPSTIAKITQLYQSQQKMVLFLYLLS